jgi:hypothetical protein
MRCERLSPLECWRELAHGVLSLPQLGHGRHVIEQPRHECASPGTGARHIEQSAERCVASDIEISAIRMITWRCVDEWRGKRRPRAGDTPSPLLAHQAPDASPRRQTTLRRVTRRGNEVRRDRDRDAEQEEIPRTPGTGKSNRTTDTGRERQQSQLRDSIRVTATCGLGRGERDCAGGIIRTDCIRRA